MTFRAGNPPVSLCLLCDILTENRKGWGRYGRPRRTPSIPTSLVTFLFGDKKVTPFPFLRTTVTPCHSDQGAAAWRNLRTTDAQKHNDTAQILRLRRFAAPLRMTLELRQVQWSNRYYCGPVCHNLPQRPYLGGTQADVLPCHLNNYTPGGWTTGGALRWGA